MPREKFVGPLKLSESQLREKSVEVGDCWDWRGCLSTEGYPIMRRYKLPCTTVRRVIFTELLGKPLKTRQPVTTSCDNVLCVNPAHVVATTLSKIGKKVASTGVYSLPARRAKIAAKRREKDGKLTMEWAAAIRNSGDSRGELATRYGVTVATIKRVKAGTSWRDYSNPFIGLMR